MRALITGACGFVGSHVADMLLQNGDEVWGVDDLSTGRRENLSSEATFWEVDISRPWMPWLMRDIDLIVHCAASYKDPLKWHRDVSTNTMGTINAVIAANEGNARLLYFQTALPPISSYAISKIAGEQYMHAFCKDYVVFRLANIYGPRNISGPIPTFYKRLSEGQECTVVDTQREMVYIADLMRAVQYAIDDVKVQGRYDICSGELSPISELFLQVSLAMGISATSAKRQKAGADDVPKMQLDPLPAERDLGWLPSTSLRDGIEQAVNWYQEHGVDATYTHLTIKG